MLDVELPEDTQAILLLCASFGQNRQVEPQPLSLSEYNSFVLWLRDQQMRPADLLTPSAKEHLQQLSINNLHPERLLALLARGVMLSLAVEKWTNCGIWILGRSDTNYPHLLKKRLKHSAPAILYGIGNMQLLSMGGLAIAGSRDVDEEVLGYTQRVAQTCAKQGIQVISGGARGVDQASMLGVLHAGGTSVGVLADSLTKAVVNSKYRSGIQEGRLTLISSYDPDAGFHVGNAMGRNKYIYALADYALVVSSSLRKGGTWAGAEEAIAKFKEIPVFVRMEPPISDGNQELYKLGAKAFPSEVSNDWRKLLSIDIAVNIKESGEEQIIISPDNSPKVGEDVLSNPQDIIYQAVLPLILKLLQQPQNIKYLAQYLDVRQSQMEDWLKRAIKEGRVKKTQKPVAYVVNKSDNQLSLWEVSQIKIGVK